MQMITLVLLLLVSYNMSFGDKLEQLSFRNAVQKIVSALPKHDLLLSTDHPTMERRVLCGSGGGDVALITLQEENGLRTRSIIVTKVTVVNECPQLIFMDTGEGYPVGEANRITFENIEFLTASRKHENVVYAMKPSKMRYFYILAFDTAKHFLVKEYKLKTKSSTLGSRSIRLCGIATTSCYHRKEHHCIYLCFDQMLRRVVIKWIEEPSLLATSIDTEYHLCHVKIRWSQFTSMSTDEAGHVYILAKDSPKIEMLEYRNKSFERLSTLILPRVMAKMDMRTDGSVWDMILGGDEHGYLLSTNLLVGGKVRIEDDDLRVKMPCNENYMYAWMNRKGFMMFVSKKYPFKVGVINV